VTNGQARSATAREDGERREGARRTLLLGLLAAPGLARDLADRLAQELPAILEERFPEVDWRIAVGEDERAGPTAGPEVDLVGMARRRMLTEGWDLVICLTDLPLLVRRRPVTVHVSVSHGVGLVSVPALGAVALEHRVREAVLRVVDGLLGDRVSSRRRRRSSHRRLRMSRRLRALAVPVGAADRSDDGETIRFVGDTVRGNVRLLLGMLRANRPWRFSVLLSRLLVAALGAGAFGMVSTGVWRVAAGLGWWRLSALCVAAVLATSASLVVAHGLWERSPSAAARQRVALFNLATALTIVIGVLTLFLALLAICLGCTLSVIAADVLGEEVGHRAELSDYLRVSLVLSMLATIGGALGAALESDEVVREAAYSYRGDDSGVR